MPTSSGSASQVVCKQLPSKLSSLYRKRKAVDGEEDNDDSQQETPIQLAAKQIRYYQNLLQQQSSLDFDDNPLEWWAANSKQMPELALVARSCLAAQATSCASERLFSKAGYIVSKYRSSLASGNISLLVFLATNG